MDLSAILPLLLKAQQGTQTTNNKTDDDSGSGEDNAGQNAGVKKNGGLNPTDLLTMMSSNGGSLDRDALLKSILPAGGGNLAQIMTLANSMNQTQNKRRSHPAGIRPIKAFANNDVIGKLVKFFQ